MEQLQIRQTASRLVKLREELLEQYPFFGRLLLRLPFGFAECGTAYTDMQRIVFDPSFAARLNDTELCFVLLHELMHCVLKHCTRGKGKLRFHYNVACDIVVNSIIMEALGVKDAEIDGEAPMHLTPIGTEGRQHNAEDVYNMLIKETEERIKSMYGASSVDSHQVWEQLARDPLLENIWNSHIVSSAKAAGKGEGIPSSMERYLEEVFHTPKISWKQVLHDYIKHDRYDYSFAPPDTRYSGDLILPSFQDDLDGSMIDKVLFFVDNSGSVSDKAISEAFFEIKDAVAQIGNMSGNVHFFDVKVSAPQAFENVEDINKIKPLGGGGTSFASVFKYVKSKYTEAPPTVIIIITDGYDTFPPEQEAMGLPVVWLIVDSEVNAPWGECLHVYSDC